MDLKSSTVDFVKSAPSALTLNEDLTMAKFESFKKAFTNRVLIAHKGKEGTCYHLKGCCVCFNEKNKVCTVLCKVYSDFYSPEEKKVRELKLEVFEKAPLIFDTESARIFALKLWREFNQVSWGEITIKEKERETNFWNHYYCPMEKLEILHLP